MELNENTERIGLGFIPTYGRLGSLKSHWPIVTGTDALRQLLLGQKYGGRIK
jgi:hypothetical protein